MDHGIPAIRHFLRNLNFSVRLIGIILVGQRTTSDVAIGNQILKDGLRQFAVDHLFIAMRIRDDLSLEQLDIHRDRAAGNRIRQLALQAFGKAVVALAGNDRQHIDGMNVVAEHVGVHALAVLIDAQAQTAANLLTLANLAAALLQCADLEHVWVIPAFAQRGMGKDKPNRRFLRITIQKQLLVLHNQVIGVRIVRRAFLFVGELAVGHLALLIDGKITGMGIMGGNFIQIPHIVVIAKFKLHRSEDIVVFFLKHIGINAVERTSRLIILLILRDLVDKE